MSTHPHPPKMYVHLSSPTHKNDFPPPPTQNIPLFAPNYPHPPIKNVHPPPTTQNIPPSIPTHLHPPIEFVHLPLPTLAKNVQPHSRTQNILTLTLKFLPFSTNS